ncbi:HDOD domain-containing protein [Massilia eurypsychrophila]|nr:HDOD domain-containing protein [Massilia eurypsychrophila]
MTNLAKPAAAISADATLAFLWDRIRAKGDMPGFARAIGAILGAMRGEDEHEFDMAQTVLTDPVLTQKVLRLANSGMYSAFGQRVNTVTKAMLVLGTDAIGHLALGLKLIEELAAASNDSSSAHAEMEKAVLAGMVAQQLAIGASARDPEEAVVCSMLHTLGRMMVSFYMPDTWTRLQQHPDADGDAAALEVLGITLEALGCAAAEHWGLPRNLVDGMRRVAPGERGAKFSHGDWLAAIGSMSSACADALWNDDQGGAARVQELAASFSAMLGVSPEAIVKAVDIAKADAADELTIAPLSKPVERRAKALASTRKRAEGNRILISGVADMRELVATGTAGQMMSMALETVYQGLTFSRAVAFLRHRRDGKYSAKVGFGDGVRERLASMTFSDVYEPNVFHAALNSDRVIFIDNARDPKFAAKLPQWWKSTLSEARSFVILPLCANGHPAGFIYGDWDDSFPPIALSQIEFALLNDVRSLVVRSVEQRKPVELVTSVRVA